MLASKSFEDQVHDLFRFFVRAEIHTEEVTYKQIEEKLFSRRYDTVVWYANNFWTWFLKKEKRGRGIVFVCQGLNGYSEEFFVAAHMKSQGKYFYHFGRALDDSRERAKARKLLKEQPDQLQPEPPEPPAEVGQEFPGDLLFADNVMEETEEIEEAESPDDTTVFSPPAISGDDSAQSDPKDTSIDIVTVQSPEITIVERIIDMFGFSRRDRDELDQLRALFVHKMQTMETQMQTLVQRQDQVNDALQQLIQTQTQGQESVHSKLADKIEELTNEFHQHSTPPDFSTMSTDLSNQLVDVEQSLLDQIKLLPVPPDLVSIRSELGANSELLQKLFLPRFDQLDGAITNVRQQVSDLTEALPVSTHENLEPLQGSINTASEHAQLAIKSLEDAYRNWIADLERHLQTTQQDHDALGSSLANIKSHVSPAGAETQNGTGSDE